MCLAVEFRCQQPFLRINDSLFKGHYGTQCGNLSKEYSLLQNSIPPVHFLQQQETFTSSTDRLQRLLAESQQMVANLELCPVKPRSRSQSPPNHNSGPVLSSPSCSNSVCSHNDGHNSTESRNQFQSPSSSQDERQPRRVYPCVLAYFLCGAFHRSISFTSV